ncbi:hypothetical protein EV426DRAFT_618442 [Tirmania nivea]|nr:hypothetical protein EV426DRAFT_618442 [Tirmania nivea]
MGSSISTSPCSQPPSTVFLHLCSSLVLVWLVVLAFFGFCISRALALSSSGGASALAGACFERLAACTAFLPCKPGLCS